MANKHRCHLLQFTTGFSATPGVVLIANVAPATLNDGDCYKLEICKSQQIPTNIVGTEAFQISINGENIPVGDRIARVLRSERVKRCEFLCMRYVQDSIITAPGATTPSPAFIVEHGIAPLYER